ncbi:MAG: DEAD/DEAH box helicase family protein [Clostridia bacterium]|nr:DEAD/DEAH box helicase family protein [Clostridia bacterium]
MNLNVFNVDNFNIIQDEENYYFFRALNMADNNDIEQGITTSANGEVERIRTDRERYDGEAKYNEDSEISLEELYDHIKMHYRKDTNCISLTSNSNIAINYARGSYKDKYVIVRIPKAELGKQTVSAGQYMLEELALKIEQALENSSQEQRQKIDLFFAEIEKAENSEALQEVISKRYISKNGELDSSKAHLRKGIVYSSPKARISSYQSLDEEQLLEVNKIYAKLAILENEHILEYVIPHSSNSKLRQTIGNAFSSMEVIHYGEIKKSNIIEIPKEVADMFALIQQVDELDKEKIEKLKIALITAVQNGAKIPTLPEIEKTVKDNISIEGMYDLTNGTIDYGKADSIVKNMFYLSKARKNAIELSNILEEILGNNLGFEDIIQYIRDNGFRIEPEIISRQSGKGVKLSESVNLNLQKEEQTLVEDIKDLSIDKLETVIQKGGFVNIQNIITKTYGNESSKIDKSRYYAEAVVSQYNWQEIGIEKFKTTEKNELIKRLQDRNCIDIYNKLKQAGIAEKQIPSFLLNIATRQGLYEAYINGNLEQLLSENREILQGNINTEIIERFLGYYDIENTGIKLKDYQQRAFNNTNEILKTHKFAQVILPTGSGKSFIALVQMQKYAQEHPNEKML